MNEDLSIWYPRAVACCLAGFILMFGVMTIQRIYQAPPVLVPDHQEKLREFVGITDLERRVEQLEQREE